MPTPCAAYKVDGPEQDWGYITRIRRKNVAARIRTPYRTALSDDNYVYLFRQTIAEITKSDYDPQKEEKPKNGPDRLVASGARNPAVAGGRGLPGEDLTQLVRVVVRVPVKNRFKIAPLGRG